MKKIRVLYAGDSAEGGPANYLLGILRNLKVDLLHLPPSKILKPALLKKPYDVIIFSDFSRKNVPEASQKIIVDQVNARTGFLMIGGWGSFSGPFGGWQHSLIETLLPVTCLGLDDRVNFPGGAIVNLKNKHLILNPQWFKNPPVICGLNQIQPKKNSQILLSARKIVVGKKGGQVEVTTCPLFLELDSFEYPLLVIDANPQKRVAAFATDAAPHWCGGLVDWGGDFVTLKVTPKIQITVGSYYIEFLSSLMRWLARR